MRTQKTMGHDLIIDLLQKWEDVEYF